MTSFNPAPGWPPVPPGWRPPIGWRPDPSWPPAPPGWEFEPVSEPGAAQYFFGREGWASRPQQTAPPKKSRGCLYAFLIVAGVLVAILVVVVALIIAVGSHLKHNQDKAAKAAAK